MCGPGCACAPCQRNYAMSGGASPRRGRMLGRTRDRSVSRSSSSSSARSGGSILSMISSLFGGSVSGGYGSTGGYGRSGGRKRARSVSSSSSCSSAAKSLRSCRTKKSKLAMKKARMYARIAKRKASGSASPARRMRAKKELAKLLKKVGDKKLSGKGLFDVLKRAVDIGKSMVSRIGQVGKIAGPLVSMIPHPAAKAVGTAATLAGNLFGNGVTGRGRTGRGVVSGGKAKAKRSYSPSHPTARRAELVRRVMKKYKVSLPEASSIIKREGLKY